MTLSPGSRVPGRAGRVTRAATVDSAAIRPPSPPCRRDTPGGSPVRSTVRNGVKDGRVTSSQLSPAAVRYSHHRASEVA